MIRFLIGVMLLVPAVTSAQTLTGGPFEMNKHAMGPVSSGEFTTAGGTLSFRGAARAMFATQYPLAEIGGRALYPTPGGMLQYLRTMSNSISQGPVSVSLSKFAVPEDFDFFINTDPSVLPLRADPGAITTANLKLAVTVGAQASLVPQSIVEVNLLAESGSFWDGPLQTAEIGLAYRDADNDGIVDGTNPPVRVKALGLYVLDSPHGLWVRLPGSTLDTAAQRVSAPAPHFSVFALIGAADQAVDSVYAFPVPWAPNSGNLLDGTLAGGITFTNLPSEGTITIFTLSGQLVQTLEISPSNPQLRWDGRTPGGRNVVSGVYLWRVQSGNNSKVGKLVVIR